jgi:hypothetical protein
MKLILRRKKQQATPFERATGFVKLGVKGLAVQRVARKALRRYKFTKRAVPLAGLAALGAVIAKKLGGGKDEGGGSAPSYTGASTGATAGTSAAAAATATTGTPPAENGAAASGPAETEAPDDPSPSPPADASGTDETLQVEAPNQSTPPPPESAKKD